MNNFFDRQEVARRNTLRLIILFALAVIAVVLAVYLAAASICLFSFKRLASSAILWHPHLFFWTTGGTLLFIGCGSYWKIQELRAGGSRIAEILGGRRVLPQTESPREIILRNVVEEMAIASGVPVPDVYLLERERAINACAAGHDLSDAVICVTRGALELLNREELQGVVAHEFSHILNGDMQLNLRLLGLLNGILLISQAGQTVLRGMRNSRGKGAGPIVLAAAALYAIGYVGYFFGRLIKSAVSRQREYLGDASAAQFTRHPEGLAGALKKIGGLASGSRLDHPRAGEVSHLFFSNCLEEAWMHALDTHPPLIERIKRLDPRFDGTYPNVTPLPAPPPIESYVKPVAQKAAAATGTILSGAAVAAMLESAGDPLLAHIERARHIIAGLPTSVTAAVRDPFCARAAVYCLLLDRNSQPRCMQETILNSLNDAPLLQEVHRLSPAIEQLAPEGRIPLLELAMPALRSMSREQFLLFGDTIEKLCAADGKTSLFEFTLRYLLMRQLAPVFSQRTPRPTQIYALRGVQKECSCVLTALARVGHRDETLAQQAFAQGAQVLYDTKAQFSFLPISESGISCLEESFSALENTSPQIKRRVLAACVECLSHDGTVTVPEIELFRAIANAIGCPLPVWLETISPTAGQTPLQ